MVSRRCIRMVNELVVQRHSANASTEFAAVVEVVV
jgi:hypothetical protein